VNETSASSSLPDIPGLRAPVPRPSLAVLADEAAVERVCRLYALAVDTRNGEMLRSVFAPEAVIRGVIGERAVADYLPAIEAGVAAYEATQHNITNQYAVVDGDRARCWSYCVALHFAAPGSGQDDMAMGVQYRDELERVDGGWRIAGRTTVQQWVRGPLPRPE
jgi:hypothetical protein